MNNREVGEMIRARRLSRGMTQGQLAALVGVTASAIGQFENGERRPKQSVGEALADAFNVPKWAIYYSEDEIMADIKDRSPMEEMLLRAYRAADETARAYALEILMTHPAKEKEHLA